MAELEPASADVLVPLAGEVIQRTRWRPQLATSVLNQPMPVPQLAYEISARGRLIVPVSLPIPSGDASAGASASSQSSAPAEDWKTDTALLDRMRNLLDESQSRESAVTDGLSIAGPALSSSRSELAEVIRNLPRPMAAATVSAGAHGLTGRDVSSSDGAAIQRTVSISPASTMVATGSGTDDDEMDRLARDVYARLRWRLIDEAERRMR